MKSPQSSDNEICRYDLIALLMLATGGLTSPKEA